jgi:hypothetical protein
MVKDDSLFSQVKITPFFYAFENYTWKNSFPCSDVMDLNFTKKKIETKTYHDKKL